MNPDWWLTKASWEGWLWLRLHLVPIHIRLPSGSLSHWEDLFLFLRIHEGWERTIMIRMYCLECSPHIVCIWTICVKNKQGHIRSNLIRKLHKKSVQVCGHVSEMMRLWVPCAEDITHRQLSSCFPPGFDLRLSLYTEAPKLGITGSIGWPWLSLEVVDL